MPPDCKPTVEQFHQMIAARDALQALIDSYLACHPCQPCPPQKRCQIGGCLPGQGACPYWR